MPHLLCEAADVLSNLVVWRTSCYPWFTKVTDPSLKVSPIYDDPGGAAGGKNVNIGCQISPGFRMSVSIFLLRTMYSLKTKNTSSPILIYCVIIHKTKTG